MHDIQMHQRERDLWIWVHGAAFEEAFQALQLTCRKVVNGHRSMLLKKIILPEFFMSVAWFHRSLRVEFQLVVSQGEKA
jgi:hypothetical protein